MEVKIIADSISLYDIRLPTLQLRYPKMIHGEVMTHRVFTRNASSSRAIPVTKTVGFAMTERVEPIRWGINQPGMAASDEELQGDALLEAKAIWHEMADTCARGSLRLGELGLHKQWANRPTEWFSNISVVLTSTEWENFFSLRVHPAAQPEIEKLASMIHEAMEKSTPTVLQPGEWHLPYVTADDLSALGPIQAYLRGPGGWGAWNDKMKWDLAKRVSAARCCRVSYLRHDGTPSPIEEDLALCARLLKAVPFHASPFEHVAMPDCREPANGFYDQWENPELHGNFHGWIQYRKLLERNINH